MKTFEEIIAFIEAKAVEHDVDDLDDWVYEFIELETFSAIMAFSLSEGFSVACCDLPSFVNKVSGEEATNDDEDEDEKNLCWLMNDITEEMGALQNANSIPAKTQELYAFWRRRFWPDFHDESDD